ncbi:hypothetical protein H6F77_02775 [Microcoleus sp. FACHB-831]|nr:hypothetical protein [Microcoleus sp. FACHB-831]MBD1920040.1 hypothetical protein [Microcoleus sp. FACHB-831]
MSRVIISNTAKINDLRVVEYFYRQGAIAIIYFFTTLLKGSYAQLKTTE